MVRPGRASNNPFSSAAAVESSLGGELYDDLALGNFGHLAKNSNSNAPTEPPTPLSADTIVTNIHARLLNSKYCTRIGGRCLVALHPRNGPLATVAAMEAVSKAHAAKSRDTNPDKWKLGSGNSQNKFNGAGDDSAVDIPDVSVFDISSSAYWHLVRGSEDQAIMLLGESGSGKSESHRQIARNLCDLSKTTKKKTKVHSAVLKTEAVFAAFGNAHTPQNRSASRFVRYTEYQFDSKGRMAGAKFIDYLLEKARVTGGGVEDDTALNGQPSRNFNIFYYLLAGATAEERQQLQLGDPAHYHYLTVSSSVSHTNEDAQAMSDLRENLKTVGIGRRQQAQLLQVIAAILHLGNVNFNDDPHSTEEPCSVKNYTQMALVADLLGLHPSALETALTYKTLIMKKDTVSVFLDAKAATEQRDSLARSLYAVVFSFVVEQVNNKLCKSESEWVNFIAVLDVPGFYSGAPASSGSASSPAGKRGSVMSGDKLATAGEPCQVGFQRLLVNFANDRLAAFTSQQLFDLPRDVLTAEQLPAPAVSASFTPASLGLLEGTDGATGILPTLDAEAARGTKDSKATERLHSLFASSPAYVAPSARKPKYAFAVRHAGGVVEYDTRGFADRNTDVLLGDFVTLVRGNPEQPGTSSAFVRSLFSDRMIATLGGDGATGTVTVPSLKRKKKGEAEETVDVSGTVGHKFRASISDILETLAETQTWFVFNIRPTDDIVPLAATTAVSSSSGAAKIDLSTVKRQVEALNISAVAANPAILYTAAFRHADLLSRFSSIISPMRLYGDPKTQCELFVRGSNWNPLQARVGKTRIFIAEREWRMMEDRMRAKEEEEAAKTRGITGDTASDYRVGGGYAASSDAGSNYRYRPRGGPGDKAGDDDDYSDDGSQFGSEFGGSVFGGSNGAKAVAPRVTKSSLGDSVIDVGPVPSTTPLDPQNRADDDAKGRRGLNGDATSASKKPKKPKKKMTRARLQWLICTWISTWWMPWFCLSICGMKRYERQIAWREKVTLCIIILLMNAFILFFIVGIGLILCPAAKVLSAGEISTHRSLSSSSNIISNANSAALVYMYGSYYAAADFFISHIQYGADSNEWSNSGKILGTDVSAMFDKSLFIGKPYCAGMNIPSTFQLFPPNNLNSKDFYSHGAYPPQTDHLSYMTGYRRGTVVWDRDSINGLVNLDHKIIVAYDRVYDVTAFYPGAGLKFTFLGDYATLILDQNSNTGQDSTTQWEFVKSKNPQQWQSALQCLNDMFYIGNIDHRNDLKCVVPNYVLLAASCVLVFIIGFKFIAALQFGIRKEPEDHDKFIICQVPCYTEGEQSMTETLQSLACLDYDDKHKLIFVIADGMIIGSGNDRPTPRIVLDILGVDPSVEPESLSFQSLGEGGKQHNMGKIYSGLYEHEGHVVPFIVVVKVGRPTERNRPGNRGKRDSQLILMRFLSRVHFNQPMTPLELGLYHSMKNIIGVEPSYYEYIFSIDADTHVYPDSLNRLVSNMVKDSKIIGICGETELSNDKKSWVTMIQVYEYFISHHLSKAFESLFGSVTCLPGCFSMYRVRTPVKAIPLIIAPGLVADYSENDVSTLHLKNLLHLGEDRYLTTLLMKHFPAMKTSFTGDAKCKTNAPEKFSVLLSQRRRWINSTVHNLFELLLLPELCGFCCFDMRFVVFIDLFATFVQPAALLYIAYLVYAFITNPATSFPLISLIMIGAIYGFQIIIFIIKQEWAHIGWMIIYILGIPFFAFFIPIYSFWNFDDFSWGNTRVVIESDGHKKEVDPENDHFDPSEIPLKLWSDYELERQERIEMQSVSSYHSKSTPGVPASISGAIPPLPSVPYTTAFAAPSVYGGTVAPPPAPASVYGSAYGAGAPVFQASVAPSLYSSPAGVDMYSPMPVSAGNSPNRQSWAAQSVTSSSTRSVPTDEEILSQVRVVLSTADLMTVTRKSVREELARVFGVDLSSRKEYIHACIDGVLRGDL